MHPIWGSRITLRDGVPVASAVDKEINIFDKDNGKRGLAVNRVAVVAGWLKADELLQWQARFTRPGTYQVQMVSVPGEHIGNAQCGVEVTVGRQSLTNPQPREDDSFSVSMTGRGYRRIASIRGDCRVESAGFVTVSLTRRQSGAVNIPLVWLAFKRMD
ncbi:MAG: hypothetical protein GX153_00330 [Clostridiaceae bacterium]|nr:hypothetical protein [Clostridiaceae bacterium]